MKWQEKKRGIETTGKTNWTSANTCTTGNRVSTG